jgi:hypothetical protein
MAEKCSAFQAKWADLVACSARSHTAARAHTEAVKKTILPTQRLHNDLRLSTMLQGRLGVDGLRRTIRALLAVLLVVVVVSIAFSAAGHWHNQTYDDQHCRVCHLAHSTAVNPSYATALPLPGLIARLSVFPRVDPRTDTIVHQLSSRGPPSA